MNYVNFAIQMLEKISDDLGVDLVYHKNDLQKLVTVMSTQVSSDLFRDPINVIDIIQFTQEFYNILFDLSRKDRDALLNPRLPLSKYLLDQLHVLPDDESRLIKLSAVIKSLLHIVLQSDTGRP